MYKDNLHNERELLLSIASGNQQAYQQLFDCYWSQIYGMGLHLTKSPEQSKDLAQDIFLKIWDNRERLPEVKNFKAYLYTITRNLIHDQVRTKVFRESNKQFLVNYFAYDESSPHQFLERKELGEALQEAINQLPPQLRQVFTLGRFEELSHEEIAKKLGITPLSSKTYMVRALMTLRKLITKNAGQLISLIFFLAGCSLF